jgi:hypothetical protein
MNVSVSSILMSGMAVATLGVIAITPVSPVAPDFARLTTHEFTALPIRADQVQLTAGIVDLITNATVALIDLYYPIRNAGQTAIDVANAIVYNPFIQVWPIKAWMSHINAAWTLGTGILDDTPPGAGVIQLLVDAVKIPQNVLNGASLSSELSHLGALSLNALNYSAAYLINYAFYQIAYFTWIWIKPITPPLFPLLPTSVEFKLPGFLTPEAPSGVATVPTDIAQVPATVKAALTSAQSPTEADSTTVALSRIGDAVTKTVPDVSDRSTAAQLIPAAADTSTVTVPASDDQTADNSSATANPATETSQTTTNRDVAADSTMKGAAEDANATKPHHLSARSSVETPPSSQPKGSAAPTEGGAGESGKQVGGNTVNSKNGTTTHRADKG